MHWLEELFGPGVAAWLPGALFLGTFVSEDLTCVTAGILVARGDTNFATATIACALGIWVSDLGLWLAGWVGARGLLRWRWLRERLPAGRAEGMRRAFANHGTRLVFASRFLPGSRLPMFVTAGALGWSFPRFAGALALAVVVWTPILVGLATGSGMLVLEWLDSWGRLAWLAVPIALLLAWLAVRLVPLLSTWRGRRLLLARWRRLTRWEYWPAWWVYPPVVALLVWKALRYRCATIFTACNPGVPHGGIVLESKGDILDQMSQDAEAPVAVARYTRLGAAIPLDERLAIVDGFLAAGAAVLKPDVGERGMGVAVVRDRAAAAAWLAACPGDALVQEFIAGVEFGVVWRRRDDGSGEIRSIARKVPPAVVGDGQRTLEQLILGDPREVAMAAFHLRRHADRLDDVPAAGERIALGELGTHCRGATFVDARTLATPALTAALDTFMATAPGLDFGRFDLRAPSDADFVAGRGIRILELNGVTGEPAHVYHPGYPWWRGVRDLCAHWAAACATGAANRARGHRPTPAGALIRLAVAARRRVGFEAPLP